VRIESFAFLAGAIEAPLTEFVEEAANMRPAATSRLSRAQLILVVGEEAPQRETVEVVDREPIGCRRYEHQAGKIT
jgi:hypothetical protein